MKVLSSVAFTFQFFWKSVDCLRWLPFLLEFWKQCVFVFSIIRNVCWLFKGVKALRFLMFVSIVSSFGTLILAGLWKYFCIDYVILLYVMKCIYNEWKGFFGWTSDLRTIFARSRREQESTSIRAVNCSSSFYFIFIFYM